MTCNEQTDANAEYPASPEHVSESLEDAAAQFQSIVESSPMGMHMYQLAADGRLLFAGANPAADRILGLDNRQFIGKSIEDAFPPLAQTEVPDRYRRAALGEPWSIGQMAYEFGETSGVFEVHAFQTGPGKMVAMFLDITERKQAEEALRESESRFRGIVDHSLDGIVLVDGEGIVILWNPAQESITGIPATEAIGKHLGDTQFRLLPEEQRTPEARERLCSTTGVMPAYLSSDANQFRDVEIQRPDGERRFLELAGFVIRGSERIMIGTIGRDITEYKNAEEAQSLLEAQLRQAHKLESIGTLASGVAHEINNPLMGMINYTELIKSHVRGDARALEYAEGVIHEGNRIAAIVRSLLSFARVDTAETSPARISDIIGEALLLNRAALHKHQITLVVDVPEDLPRVRCRSQQIQQVFVNLITNAQAALNERYSGHDENKILSIFTSCLSDQDGDWVRTTFEDRGSGIPSELQDRIFDPFFTSKSRTQGTGLGLSVSHGIITNHSGRMSLESDEGKPTRFHVDLPLPTESAESNATP